MIKRVFDFCVSLMGLVVVFPILVPTIILVWLQDFQSPFYIAKRVGRDKKLFSMYKLRSMVVNADRSGVDSTSADDKRITSIGRVIRKFKLDELSQLWNVLIGDMSLVGPRPNVERETNLYTEEEKRLLTVRPGITDFASIVFSDEGDILEGSKDPDLKYNQLIRPWKSRLALICIDNSSLFFDITIIFLTVIAIFNRSVALRGVGRMLEFLQVDPKCLDVALRKKPLEAYPPPGSNKIVSSRN